VIEGFVTTLGQLLTRTRPSPLIYFHHSSGTDVSASRHDPRTVEDDAFDAVYDRRIRGLSLRHWTPVAVAARAAAMLVEAGATRILDVGSGVGKFCLVGAMRTDAEFVGVELREDLVHVARQAAKTLGVSRATFVHADVADFPFAGFDGVFLYNPFFEHVTRLRPIDKTVERSRATYERLVTATVAKLAELSTPGAIVTFSGFGGRVPPDAFEFLGEEAAGNDWLERWVKR
jgi:cyclopropane fatty-acyl-phospholipid synthase-like methyltransferase